MDAVLREAVLDAAARREVREAVERVYGELKRRIEERRPVCLMTGRCCRFDEYGHRLYVTTMELAAFWGGLEAGRRIGEVPGGCPFQEGKLCGVHAIRPFGCRIFFCDPTATQWQENQYELFHAELKRLHESLGVPYFYVEWRRALQVMADGADCR